MANKLWFSDTVAHYIAVKIPSVLLQFLFTTQEFVAAPSIH